MRTLKPILIVFSLITICALPMVCAHFLYSLKPNLRRTNNGQLLQPTYPLSDLASLSQQPKHWMFLYIEPNSRCDELCKKDIITIRQVRLALGVDATRIERVLALTHGMRENFDTAEQPDLIQVQLPEEKYQKLASAFNLKRHDGLYVVDPAGRIMMHYGADLKPKPIYDDMKRLLKYG